MRRRVHHETQRAVQPGELFPGDKKVVPRVPHKHAALAKRLAEESNRRRAALAEFYRLRPAVPGTRRPIKRSKT